MPTTPEVRSGFIEKLPLGSRVKYEYGRWTSNDKGEVVRDDQLATRAWALEPRTGTVVPDEKYGPFPQSSPWGVPVYATAVHFDGEARATWVRSACLEQVGFAQKEADQFELFTFCDEPSVALALL